MANQDNRQKADNQRSGGQQGGMGDTRRQQSQQDIDRERRQQGSDHDRNRRRDDQQR